MDGGLHAVRGVSSGSVGFAVICSVPGLSSGRQGQELASIGSELNEPVWGRSHSVDLYRPLTLSMAHRIQPSEAEKGIASLDACHSAGSRSPTCAHC